MAFGTTGEHELLACSSLDLLLGTTSLVVVGAFQGEKALGETAEVV